MKEAVNIGREFDGARILWRMWLQEVNQVREGYVREFSPRGDLVRISDTPRKRDRGDWKLCAEVRVVEVLQDRVDFNKVEEEAREEERRERRIEGDEWKD